MQCNGCSACSVVCPKQCIEMKYNKNGFLRPETHTEKCINCNLCKGVCVYNHAETRKLCTAELYSSYAKKDIIRRTTSSGGIGYLIASEAIKRNEIVCGAEFNYSSFLVEHNLYCDIKGIDKTKGSKYLQSNCTSAFSELNKMLKCDSEKRAVVFGTPCQIIGLKNVLESNGLRDRVLLVDFFCHGVPSIILWQKYLKQLEKQGIDKNTISKIVFRDKKYSWHEYYMHIYYETGEYVLGRDKDAFLKLFSMGVLNQKECFSCELRNESGADIRIGDFWGKRHIDSEEGYSMVIPLTDKGEKYFNLIQEIESEKGPIEERLGQQHEKISIPDHYEKGFQLLLSECKLVRVIHLYNPLLKRIKSRIKKMIKGKV